MKNNNLSLLPATFICLLFLFSSCSKDNAPVAEIFFEVDKDNQLKVYFTTTNKNVKTYSWGFGDENSSTEAEPVHTYDAPGIYTVTLIATGDGGETTATKEVGILGPVKDMLTGGEAMPNGKTWVMSRTATTTHDGAGPVKSHFPIDMAFPDNILDGIGLSHGYDIEYTFTHDGGYAVNNKGETLAGWQYAVDKATITVQPLEEYGIYQIAHTSPTSSTWELTQDDLVIEAVYEDSIDKNITKETVTFKDATYLTFTNGGFIGILDYNTTAIIREINNSRMIISIFNSTADGYKEPLTIITASFEAKQ